MREWPGRIGSCSAPPTAKHQIFHAIGLVDLGSVDVAVEDDHLHVLAILCNVLVRIIALGDRPESRPGEYRVVKEDEGLTNPF